MVHALVIALFLSIFSVDYLVHQQQVLNAYMILVPEALSGIATVVVFARIVGGARIRIDWRYWAFIAGLFGIISFGYLVQDVSTGTMVAGVRSYLKFLPFFLLPAVYRFTPQQLKAQLTLLLVLLALQTPLALYQRFIEFAARMNTGDPVRGTAATSSALSMLLVCGIAGVVSLYLRRRLSLLAVVCLIAWLFAPTTLNETKATALLLPVALFVPAFVARGTGVARRLVPIIAIGCAAGIAFFVVYNTMIQYREHGQRLDDFVDTGSFTQYLYTGAAKHDAKYMGRFDTIQFALDHTSRDPLTFAFGMGAGNVSPSFKPQFQGKYVAYYDRYGVGMTEATTLLWEVGIVGLLGYVALYFCVFNDSRTLARSDDELAALGQFWAAVMVVMTFALIYKATFAMNEIGYLLWYFSGVVVSRTAELRARATARARPPRPAAWHAAAADMPRVGAADGWRA